ncbi:hypothetical protein GBK04_05870 [Cytophagaceae bacterium SJW1-29]|uniref:Fatty acid desaturase domain-containing protein n=1 Tax=Salmonirosea aquatica TaxID=2654236 RepID=A0A7C9BH28_9BACT|nr:hypothetical protein [Cytophagaceae bacterium SJW1-29]
MDGAAFAKWLFLPRSGPYLYPPPPRRYLRRSGHGAGRRGDLYLLSAFHWGTRPHAFFSGGTFPRPRKRSIIRGNVARLLACIFYLMGTLFLGGRVFACVLAQFILVTLIYESVTYIQHYGLRRKTNQIGQAEAVQLHHAWNCYYRTSTWMHYMMPVHSIHHLREERLDEIRDFAGLSMPLPFAKMLVRAWIPARWFRLMDEKVPTHARPEKYEA